MSIHVNDSSRRAVTQVIDDGIMSTQPAVNVSNTIGYDFEDQTSNFKQVARSDGFKNWSSKP